MLQPNLVRGILVKDGESERHIRGYLDDHRRGFLFCLFCGFLVFKHSQRT